MKKLIIAGALTASLFTVTAISLANMTTLNLLLSGSSYSTSTASPFNVNGDTTEEGEPYNPTKEKNGGDASSSSLGELLQSGLTGGGTGGNKLNLLWLLQNANEPSKESYAYQLLAGYSNLESGKYNDYPYHVSPTALVGSHFNETKLQTFLVPGVSGFGKVTEGRLGQTVNGKKLTLENAGKNDIAGRTDSYVWVDATGDGHPDGPFQIEEGNKSNKNANKVRGDGVYDLYNFPDSMNVLDDKFNGIMKSLVDSGVAADPHAVSASFGLYHNRGMGGVIYMLFGAPYTNLRETVTYSDYLKRRSFESLKGEELKVAMQFPNEFVKWLQALNLPMEEISGNNVKSQALASLVVVSKGGFLDKEVGHGSAKHYASLPDKLINQLFPGQSSSTIVKYLNSYHVKKPWDVLGMSKSEYNKIYGASAITSNYEEIYRSSKGLNHTFYIDKDVKSKNYVAGEHIVVRAIEWIALGYMIDTSLMGEVTLLKLALEAGIKSLTDSTIVDPTNPQTVYQKIAPESSGTYNPASSATGNFGKFLDGLGLTGKLSETQQAQLKAMYEISGGYYSQPKRGTPSPTGELYTDCSYYASFGLHLGIAVSKPYPITDDISKGVWLTNTNKTKEINGKSYTANVVQIDSNGQLLTGAKTMKASAKMHDKEWVKHLQTGDILVTYKRGHVMTYAGQNTSDKTMVLSPDISKVKANMSTIKAGEHFFMHAMGREGNKDKLMGLTPHISPYRGDLSNHFALRPTFNIK